MGESSPVQFGRSVVVLLTVILAASSCAFVARTGVGNDGSAATDAFIGGRMSGDGRFVAFSTFESLEPGDQNGMSDVYVRDHLSDTTERVSVAADGGDPDGLSVAYGGVSDDGRYVLFGSQATNLIPGGVPTPGAIDWHTYRRDRQTGVTELVSVDPSGDPVALPSISLPHSMTRDGRYVTMFSTADDLATDDEGSRAPFDYDVFVRDMVTGTTELISETASGIDGDANSYDPFIAADGRFVAFLSEASDLVAGDGNGVQDVFVHDLETGTTSLVTVDATGGGADGASYGASVSADGRFVAFSSDASDLVAGDTNGLTDVFVRDMVTGTTERVSVDAAGGNGDGTSGPNVSISDDGRTVAFQSEASDLIVGDTNGTADVFVRDRQRGVTDRVHTLTTFDQADRSRDRGGDER